jgi:hypothetical protein
MVFGLMPAPAKRASRYSMDRCLLEIATMRDHLGLQDKDVFLSIGMTQATFSRKMAGVRKFTVEELGAIADYFAEQTGRTLPGWPLLSEQHCRTLETGRRHDPPGPENP